MNKPLTVLTEGEGKAHVRAYADAVLFRNNPSNVNMHEILGMSVIGPEQSIRAIAAGCALKDPKRRVTLRFMDENGKRIVSGRWPWRWNVLQSMQLVEGAMHMVALADAFYESIGPKNAQIVQSHRVIVPPENTAASLEREIYRTLLAHYTTPLIPVEGDAQPAWEDKAGRAWRKAVVAEILSPANDLWTRLLPHPDQTYKGWELAGVLTLTDPKLDKLVSDLLRTRRITIPVPPSRDAA
jgi:hypothetical protein